MLRRSQLLILAGLTWLAPGFAHAGEEEAEPPPATEASPPVDDLDFDLLGEAPPVAPVDTEAVELRRTLLNFHQGLGIALMAATVALCTIGQLSYEDRYHGDMTGRFELTHALLAYSTAGLFAVTGTAAILAPLPYERQEQGFDRSLVHKIALGAAGVAMLTGAVLGYYGARREGRLNQQDLLLTHLGVSWAALASMTIGVAILIF